MHSRNTDPVWFIYIRNCGHAEGEGCCANWFPIHSQPMTWADVIAQVATMDDTHREHAIVHMSYQHKYTGDNR